MRCYLRPFFIGLELDFNTVVEEIINAYNWEPAAIGRLFYDRQDYEGVLFWYDRAIIRNKQKNKR